MKRIFTISLIIIIIFNMLVIFPISVKSDYTSICLGGITSQSKLSFDGVASGLDEYVGANAEYISWKNTGPENKFETSTDGDVSSPNSLHIDYQSHGKGYLNLTTTFTYIYQLNFSLYTLDSDSSLGAYDYCYMYFNDTYGNTQIKMYWKTKNGGGNYVIYWYDNSHTPTYWRTLYNLESPQTGVLLYFIITHNQTNFFDITILNDDLSYYNNYTYAGAYAGDYETFSSIYITDEGSTCVANGDSYFDNFYIQYSNYVPTLGYSQDFCNGDLNGFRTTTELKNNRFIESKFISSTGLNLNGNISEVRLPVSEGQYEEISSNLSDYKLRVSNGAYSVYFGYADEWEYDEDNSCYWVIWNDYSMPINNSYLIFSFECAEHGPIGPYYYYYWYTYPYYCKTYSAKVHNTSTMANNNIWDGTSLNSFDDHFLTCHPDIYYCFTVEDFQYGSTYIPSGPDEFINTSLMFHFYDIRTGNKLEFITLDWYNGPIYNPFDEGGLFNPYEDDRVIIASFGITALSGNGNEYHVYENPQEDYFYSYQPVVYNNVKIAPNSDNIVDFMGNSGGNIIGFINNRAIIFNRYIRTMELTPFGTYDIYLTPVDYLNNTGNIPEDDEEYYDDYFNTSFYCEFANQDECGYRVNEKPTIVYHLDETNYSDANGYFYEIKFEDNSTFSTGYIFLQSLEETRYINIIKDFDKEGHYHILLYNLTFDAIHGYYKDELVKTSHIITVCEGEKVPSGGEGGFVFDLSGLPIEIKLILSIIIIALITVLPLFLVALINKNRNSDIELPALVYVAFFFVGMISDVSLKLLSASDFFIVLFGLIIAFAIFWISNKRGES